MRSMHAKGSGGVLRVGNLVYTLFVCFCVVIASGLFLFGVPRGGRLGGSTRGIPRRGPPEVPQELWVDSRSIMGVIWDRFWFDCAG
jgi:hypothetical protein